MPAAKPTFLTDAKTTVTEIKADALIIFISHQKEAADKGFELKCDILKSLNDALDGQLLAQAHEEKFEGAKNKTLSLRTFGKLPYKRLVLVGIGCKDKATPIKYEEAAKTAASGILGLKGFSELAILFPNEGEPKANLYAVVDGMVQSTYRSAEATKPGPELKQVTLLVEAPLLETVKATLPVAEALADSRSFAKDLVNMPSNLKTTQTMVEAANALKTLPNVSVEIISDVAWIEKEMPSFYSVARGSLATDPPKFIKVAYQPEGAPRKLAFVGKTVIFDTGGYQVKPGNSMVTMKGDMTGGAMVLGAVRSLATLKAPVALTVYLAATPNKIDSDAFIPDSIIGSTVGKKVEIRHTDAEGRLTLIDAVTKAAEDKPDEILTIATLTGAAMRAVGCAVALMSQDDALRDRVKATAKTLDEPFQTLDIFESDFDDIKSKLDGADIRNTSSNENRGAQTAACFVFHGAPEGMPIVHLDIAGADMTKDEKATGIGQKTLVLYALNQAS